MSVTVTATREPGATSPPRTRRGSRWIEDWRPEDQRFWESTGRGIARRNLAVSVLAEHVGFVVWTLWTVVVLNLGNAGFPLSLAEQFWLTALPNLVGALLRVPYTFAVPRFGGRAWTMVSAGLLLVPCLLLALLVPSAWLHAQPHATQFWVLLGCAATAGVGGGNFSSSMANISFFYPERRKGLALGINAAGGNLGVAVAQLVVPLVLVIGVPAALVHRPRHPVHLGYVGWFWIPFVVVALILAATTMSSLTEARADTRSYTAALRYGQTWVMSLLYVGTFGSFIGFSFALPLVIRNTFPGFLAHHAFVATYLAGLAFTGALVGSVARPLGGWLADRRGGATVTVSCFGGMAVLAALAAVAVRAHSFGGFFAAFVGLFALAGAGNGSTYRMIPSIFAQLGRAEAARSRRPAEQVALEHKRLAAAVIGIAGAVGALGGFLVQVTIRQSSLQVSRLVAAARTPAQKVTVAAAHADWVVPALSAFVAAYVVLAGLTWFYYLRRRLLVRRVASFASARASV